MNKARIKYTYRQQLNHKLWFEKREEILSRDNHKCLRCGCSDNLDVHHTYYENDGRNAWDYDSESLVTLCRKCHTHVHFEFEKIIALISIQVIKKGMSFTDVAFKLGVL
jgi:5-methylcytosine-specific restriction endonuclease McrA